MLDAFLCKHHIFKYFARMLNSRDFKFANISENNVLANNSGSTVFTSAPGFIFVEVSPTAEEERISLLKPNDILSTSYSKRT